MMIVMHANTMIVLLSIWRRISNDLFSSKSLFCFYCICLCVRVCVSLSFLCVCVFDLFSRLFLFSICFSLLYLPFFLSCFARKRTKQKQPQLRNHDDDDDSRKLD